MFRGNCTEGLVSMLVWTQRKSRSEGSRIEAGRRQERKAKSKTSPPKPRTGHPIRIAMDLCPRHPSEESRVDRSFTSCDGDKIRRLKD